MEMELDMPEDSIHRILTKHLGIREFCARFLPHKCTISSYSPDLVPYDFYLFGKLHLSMKGKRHADIENIQRSTTAILNIISANGIKMSFNLLFVHAERCIQSEGDYFE